MSITSSVVTSFLISIGDAGLSSELLIDNTLAVNEVKDVHFKANDKEYNELYSELCSYQELKTNWDGYDGVKPSAEIINTARNFINILKNNKIIHPKLMVSGKGNISLFWKAKNNYIEIEFDLDGHLSFFYRLDNNLYGEDDILISEDIPNKLIYSLNYFKNEISSKEIKYVINDTRNVDTMDDFLINAA